MVQTASTITICHSFLFGVDTGISLPNILPLVAGYIPNFGFSKFPLWTL